MQVSVYGYKLSANEPICTFFMMLLMDTERGTGLLHFSLPFLKFDTIQKPSQRSGPTQQADGVGDVDP